jgi:hypothetical protein
VVDAQAEVSRATLNLDKVQNMRPLQVEENDVQIQQRSTNQPAVHNEMKVGCRKTLGLAPILK